MDSDTPSLGWPQRGTKRSYADIESHPRRNRSTHSPSWRMEGPSRTRSSDVHIQLPPIQPRWIGDGLDFRRPMRPSNSPISSDNSHMTNASGRRPSISIIDLTNDDAHPARPSVAARTGHDIHRPSPPSPAAPGTFGQASRGPRFPQEIIDLSADSPEVPPQSLPQTNHRHRNAETESNAAASPEVEFVSARVLPEPPRNVRRLQFDPFFPAFPNLSGAPRNFSGTSTPLNRDNGDDEVEITAERALPTAEYFRRAVNLMSRGPRGPDGTRNTRVIIAGGQRPRLRGGDALHMQFFTPDLDFNVTAFGMGLDFDDDHRAETASPPVVPPPAAPAGFTRSPAEGDALVCPNCDDELCSGESDIKKQVWIVKGCGHVYCGECTVNRYASKTKKAKRTASTKPFKECVVEGCGKKTSTARAMIQLFL